MRKKEKKQIASSSTSWTPRNDGDVLGIRQILRENWKFLVGLCLGVFLLYVNSLGGDFVSDDYASITQNPSIFDTSHFLKAKSIPGIVSHIIAKLFGISSPVPFHLTSLILYLGICILVFVFLSILAGKKIAAMATILFGVHPVHVEAVSWISGRPYLLTTFFVLIGLISGVLYLKGRREKKYLYFIFLSMVLNFFNDPIRGFSLYLLAMLIFFTFGNEFFPGIRLGKFFLVFVVIFVVTMPIVWPLAEARISAVNGGYNASESVFYEPWFQYPTAVTKYLQLLLVPIDLTLYHTMYTFPVWLNWLVIMTYFVLLVYSWFKNKLIFFGLAFIFVASSPSMMPVKVSWLVAERYVFFGSIGFGLFLALVGRFIFRKSQIIAWSGFLCLVVIYSLRVVLRNIDWQTNHNLWVNTCQVSPNSHNAWNNIGDDYDKLGDYANSIKGFAQSTVVKPNYADAYHNRANIYYKIGRLDLARETYETALTYSPGLFQTYFSLTQIDLMEEKIDLAIKHAQKALDLQPNNPQAWYVAGVVSAQAGDREGGIKAFKNALSIDPGFGPAREGLSSLLGGS